MFIIWPTTHLFFSAFCADHRDPHVFSSSTTVKCRGIARKRFISKIIKIPRKNKCAMMVKATLNPCIYLHSPSMVHAFFSVPLAPTPYCLRAPDTVGSVGDRSRSHSPLLAVSVLRWSPDLDITYHTAAAVSCCNWNTHASEQDCICMYVLLLLLWSPNQGAPSKVITILIPLICICPITGDRS